MNFGSKLILGCEKMIDTVKIIPANESEREEGELCSDDEMLEDVSSGDNISSQITLYDNEKDIVQYQSKPYGIDNIQDGKARPSAKWSTLKREMSLSEISDEEYNKDIPIKRHRRSQIVSRKDTTDSGSREDNRKRSISSIVVEKLTVTKNRGEKRPVKSSCHSTRKRRRKCFHKPLRSLSSNSIQISSSESDVEVNYECKRKLSDAVHIDKATTNNHLKVRLGSMLKKTTSGEDENKVMDNSHIAFSIPQKGTVNKLLHVKNVPNNILDIEKTSIVPISNSSDEEPDLIRLRLLALQTKPKTVSSNTNTLSSENENRNNDSDEVQENQLRMDALKSAVIKKHLARQKRKEELQKIKQRRSSSEFSYSPSSPTSISSYDYQDSNLEDNDRPYSPSEPIETITESNNTNLFSPVESIKLEVVDDNDFNILGDRMTPIDMNIDNESNDDTESNLCIEPVKLKPVETNETVKPNENSHYKVKDHPILGGWVPVTEPDNSNKKKKCKNIKTNLVHIISNSCKKNIKPNGGVFKKTLQPVENQVINNNPVLGNPIFFNVNKPVVCEQEKQLDTGTKKDVEKKVDAETDAEEDEDILRAMLLTNLSTKIAKKSEPENNEIKNIPIVQKNYKENELIGKNPKLNIKKRVMAPTCEKKVTQITKTVTNNKVINKNVIVKPTSTATSESEQRLLTMIGKPVSKLVINIRASESETDDEDPFKSKCVKSDQVNVLPPIPEKEEVNDLNIVSATVTNAGNEIVVNVAKDSTPVANSVQQDPEFQKSLEMLLKTARDQSRKEIPIPFSPSPVVDTKPVEVLSESRQEEYRRLKRQLHFLQKRNAARNASARTENKLAIAKLKVKEKLVETPKPVTKFVTPATTRSNIELPVITVNNDLCEQHNTHNEIPEKNNIFSNSVIVEKANSINVTVTNDLLENNSETPDIPLDDNKVIRMDEENVRRINITIKNDFIQATDVNKNIQITSETTSDINKNRTKSDNCSKQRSQQYLVTKKIPLYESRQECAPKKCNANVNPDVPRHRFLSENEKKLVEGRYTFAKDLEHMLNLISSAEKEKEIQTDLEEAIFALKEQLIKTEKKLKIQKFITSSMYNRIGEYGKEIGKGRQAYITMSNTCNELGTAVYGALYRTPSDGLELLKTKLQTLADHTFRLRANNKDKSSTDLEIQDESLIDEILKEQNEEIKDTDNYISEVTIQNNNTFEDNSIINEVDMTTKDTSVILQNKKSQESIIPIKKPDEDSTSFNIPEYISPLLHMQTQSYSNPDAILCPYDLMGRCEDSSCKYQHIS